MSLLVSWQAGTRPLAALPAGRRPWEGPGGPTPRLADVRVEDLEDAGRLLELHRQAVARGAIADSEADRLRFVGAAEHAPAIGRANPPGLFCDLTWGRLWRYRSQEDEDRAVARLKVQLRATSAGPAAS